MNIDSARKKLVDGRLVLEKAGDDSDLLGIALTKIHAALEDACRCWLSAPGIAQQHQLNVQNRTQISGNELLALMPRYYYWRFEDVEYVRRFNHLRNQALQGEDFQGKRQDIEAYALYVENWLKKDGQPKFSDFSPNHLIGVSEIAPSQAKKSLVISYLLWGLGFFHLCGIHRLYLGKPVTGLMWLFSFGFLYIGQIVDLFLIPSMVRSHNTYAQRRSQPSTISVSVTGEQLLDQLDTLDRNWHRKLERIWHEKPSQRAKRERHLSPMHLLLEVAAANGRVLSFGQAVMRTGLPYDEVQKLLDEALRTGIAYIDNDRETGAVRYHFDI